MGVGGKFWEQLKPCARHEGFDFLRNKRVAVDLSLWIVQHETAMKASARNPHTRITFLRTINLFSKFGAYPVFVVDGTPSPLKARVRIMRFSRASGIDISNSLLPEEGISVERNQPFVRCVEECVELLELLGMPVLRAKGEAEALCAELNAEGHVDACITADSDAFLYGAKCVIKCIQPNSTEPFECYHMSDIEAHLNLKRNHLIAISVLVGNDHDISGVQGIGIDTALRFVHAFSEVEILDRLQEIGKGNTSNLQEGSNSTNDFIHGSDASSQRTNYPHCSFCGHPGTKKSHLKSSCECCSINTSAGCLKKPKGFKCDCFSCDVLRKEKERRKLEKWHIKVCKMISTEQNFPKDNLIEMYLSNSHGYFPPNDGPCISWKNPNVEMVADFLAYHQLWEPSYTRQRLLPMLSTIFLREVASESHNLLYGQYEFDSIQKIKMRFGHQFYVVKWRKAAMAAGNFLRSIGDKEQPGEFVEDDESTGHLDEPAVPQIQFDDNGCCFLLTDENIELVQAAFPQKVDEFLMEKELEASTRKRPSSRPGSRSNDARLKSESPKLKGVQLSITGYYRSNKVLIQEKQDDELGRSPGSSEGYGALKEKRSPSNSNLSKSARRRLLFS